MGKASNFLTVEIFLIMYPVQLERNMPGLSQEKQKTFFSMVGGGGGGGGWGRRGGGLQKYAALPKLDHTVLITAILILKLNKVPLFLKSYFAGLILVTGHRKSLFETRKILL